MTSFFDFVELCKDAERFLEEIKHKDSNGKLKRIKPRTLKASAIRYLARKRRITITLCELYQIYRVVHHAMIRTEKIFKELDEEGS